MRHRIVLAVGALALAGLAGCTTPPIDTPKSQVSVTLGDLWPDAPEAAPAVVPANLPAYPVKKDQGGLAVQVPDQARQVSVTSSVLHLSLTNRMKLPLTLTFYLAKENPYAAANQLGTASLAPGETRQIDAAFDPALLKNPVLHAGVEVAIGKTAGPVLVRKADPLEAITWATVQVKLL